MVTVRMAFGELVKKHRATKFTQAALAEKVSMSRIAIAKIEAGTLQPRLDHAVRIASVLSFSLGDIHDLLKERSFESEKKKYPRSIRARLDSAVEKVRKDSK